jgi:hypothetical protein
VDLPAPLGPRKAKKLPFSTEKSIPLTASIDPNDFLNHELQSSYICYLIKLP